MAEVTHKFDAKLAHAALSFAAEADIRYYLNGLHVRRDANGKGCIIEAANGHMAVMIHDPRGESTEQDVIICRDAIKALPKTGVLKLDDEGVLSSSSVKSRVPIQAANAVIDGKYPDLSRIIPKWADLKPGISSDGVNSVYLDTTLKFFSAYMGKYNFLHSFQTHDGSPAVFMSGDKNAVVLVMPVRDRTVSFYPDWVPAAGA